MPASRRFPKPVRRFFGILGDAFAGTIESCQIVLPLGKTLAGALLKPVLGLTVIARHTPTLAVNLAEIVLGLCITPVSQWPPDSQRLQILTVIIGLFAFLQFPRCQRG